MGLNFEDLKAHLSHEDYTTLRETPVNSWGQEKTALFLISGVFPVFNEGMKQWHVKFWKLLWEEQKRLSQKYNPWKAVFFVADTFFLWVYQLGNRKNKKNILFKTALRPELLLAVAKKHHVGLITEAKADRFFALTHAMGYVSINYLDNYVFRYLENSNFDFLATFIKKIQKRLEAAKPDFIFLDKDVFPLERAIIMAAKKMGAKTLEIQHGIYNPNFFPLTDGNAADYALVWGQYFKDFYVKAGIRKPEEIYVLGYPLKMSEKAKQPRIKNGKYVVCYIAEDYERRDPKMMKEKIFAIRQLKDICKKIGMDFMYRAHPHEYTEEVKKEFPDIHFIQKGTPLVDVLTMADVFVSYSSTALVEAAMYGKIALQVMSYPAELVDNYETLGICNKTCQNFQEVECYLKEVAASPDLERFKIKFNTNYIETKYDPTKRILEIIQEISHGS